MLAARYMGPGLIEPEEVSLPEPGMDEALIEVEACGFCGSDLNIVAGTHPRAKAPLTLGHELAGRIVEINSPVTDLKPGDRVTAFPLISCGHCFACTHGCAHVCRELRLFGFDVDGGMAQYVKLPVSALIRLPHDLPPRIGALIEPLAVAVHGVRRAQLEGVSVAVVLGAGPIGLLTGLVLRHRGVPMVVVSDVLPSRIELALRLGLQAVSAGSVLRQLVMDRSGQNGADLLFDCAGHPSAAQEMTDLIRSRGVIINLGVYKKPVEVDMQAVNFKEVTIIGSRVYERKDFTTAIDLAPHLPLDGIVTREYPLRDVSIAFEHFRSGGVCKALIVPSEELA